MNRRRFLTLVPALVPACRHTLAADPPVIPASLEPRIPGKCRQILLVSSPERSSVVARASRMSRTGPEARWQQVGDSLPVTLGRNGLAWGLGTLTPPPPPGWPVKREGDGCSPAGVFPITFAFGSAPARDEPGIRLPYRQCVRSLRGVDDPASRYYNQVVDELHVRRDWKSSEDMLRDDGLYRRGAFVAHNPHGLAGRGSCIFLHLWEGPRAPTSGCTAMDESNLRNVLEWLDPAARPCLVQSTRV
jgi:L,D-peptidoglycan transpeptidase YkuD (ErfK/YbiS/YcfS/YnhG family)